MEKRSVTPPALVSYRTTFAATRLRFSAVWRSNSAVRRKSIAGSHVGVSVARQKDLMINAGQPETKPNFLARTLVLIPAYNEAECVAGTVRFWQKLGAGHIRVVDNGSNDATAQEAKTAGAEVLFERRRGYGAACWTGLQKVSGGMEWILFSSADGSDQLSASEIPEWQRRVASGADLLIGDRTSLSQSRQHLKWVQRWGNGMCCWLIFLGWGRRFRDLGSLRMIRLEALRRLRLEDRGFGWNIEMQVRAIEEGLQIIEVPILYQPRRAGQSKISGSVAGTIRAATGMMGMITKLWFGKARRRRSA